MFKGPDPKTARAALIPNVLPLPTPSIVDATLPHVRNRRGAIMLRMWHYVGEGAARTLLFEDFVLDGEPLGLIEAIAATAREGRWGGRLPRLLHPAGAAGWADHAVSLEQALVRALRDVFGKATPPEMLSAWGGALRLLLLPPSE